MHETNEHEVAKLISKINPNKSCGIDLIDPLIITQLASTLVPILSNIFNKSINTGRIPDKLEEAIIISRFINLKTENVFVTTNPICILPIFSKILERITYNSLYKYLEKNVYFI